MDKRDELIKLKTIETSAARAGNGAGVNSLLLYLFLDVVQLWPFRLASQNLSLGVVVSCVQLKNFLTTSDPPTTLADFS